MMANATSSGSTTAWRGESLANSSSFARSRPATKSVATAPGDTVFTRISGPRARKYSHGIYCRFASTVSNIAPAPLNPETDERFTITLSPPTCRSGRSSRITENGPRTFAVACGQRTHRRAHQGRAGWVVNPAEFTNMSFSWRFLIVSAARLIEALSSMVICWVDVGHPVTIL